MGTDMCFEMQALTDQVWIYIIPSDFNKFEDLANEIMIQEGYAEMKHFCIIRDRIP